MQLFEQFEDIQVFVKYAYNKNILGINIYIKMKSIERMCGYITSTSYYTYF